MHAKEYMRRWYMCRARARKFNCDFCSSEEMRQFWESPHICEYCEIPEEIWLKRHKRKLEIDRKDSSSGYVISNITWACHRCNTIKNNFLSYQEMKEIGQKYIKPKWQANIQRKVGYQNGR
jgi:hypothetical protein